MHRNAQAGARGLSQVTVAIRSVQRDVLVLEKVTVW